MGQSSTWVRREQAGAAVPALRAQQASGGRWMPLAAGMTDGPWPAAASEKAPGK